MTDDYRRLSFNTAVAALMEYTNELYKLKTGGFSDDAWREALQTLMQLIAPAAPHMAAELWQQLGNNSILDTEQWPVWDEALLVSDTMTIVVQVNGKVRAKLELDAEMSEDAVVAAALADQNVQKFVEGGPKKTIYVPGRLLNIVA